MSNLGRFPGSSLLQILTSRAMWEEIPGGSDNRRPSMAIFSIDFIFFKIQNNVIEHKYLNNVDDMFYFHFYTYLMLNTSKKYFYPNINGLNVSFSSDYLLSFQSPWETTLRVAPLWFQVPTAVQQSSTCLLPSGLYPLVVSEGLKPCNKMSYK